jgi:hypothetical protein
LSAEELEQSPERGVKELGLTARLGCLEGTLLIAEDPLMRAGGLDGTPKEFLLDPSLSEPASPTVIASPPATFSRAR